MLQFGQNILSVNRWISLSFWCLSCHSEEEYNDDEESFSFHFFHLRSFADAQDDNVEISIFESQVFSTFEAQADSHDLSIT